MVTNIKKKSISEYLKLDSDRYAKLKYKVSGSQTVSVQSRDSVNQFKFIAGRKYQILKIDKELKIINYSNKFIDVYHEPEDSYIYVEPRKTFVGRNKELLFIYEVYEPNTPEKSTDKKLVNTKDKIVAEEVKVENTSTEKSTSKTNVEKPKSNTESDNGSV